MNQEEINRVTMIHATQKEWTPEEREAWPEWLREMRSVLVANPEYTHARVTPNGSVRGGTFSTLSFFHGRDMVSRGFVLYREMLRDTVPAPVMEAKPLPPAKPVVSEQWTDKHTEQLREANERLKNKERVQFFADGREIRIWDRDRFSSPESNLDARIAVARTELDRPVSAPRFPHEGRSERALPRSNARR